MTVKNPRIVLFAPHFAEYATRLAIALGKLAPTLLIVERSNRANECPSALMDEARQSVSVMEFTSTTRLGRRLALVLIPLRILMFRPDIVHVQEQPDVVTATIARILARFKRIVLTVHDPKPHSGGDADYARRRDGYRQALRDAAVLYHVHGDFCRDLLLSLVGDRKPIVSTAHGVLMLPAPSRIGAPKPGRVLLFGRMEAYKGIETLLDAGDILQRRGVAFHIVLAGRGPELIRLKDRLTSSPFVTTIAKFLTPAEAVQAFQNAAVVVAPYRDATQSGVVAAAFGNERPVVATRSGGLVDSVRHEVDGLLVASQSPEALAAALERVLTEGALRERLEAGARDAKGTIFAWDRIAAKLVEAYPDAIGCQDAARSMQERA